MKREIKIRLGLVSAALGGLLALTSLQAEDKAKPEPGKSEAPMPVWATTAVKPKPLSENIKKGLDYLVKQQHENGGWGQGGGWRTAEQGGGRVEGKDVQDPPDLGNTCIAALALIRAGNTPNEGPYAKNVAKALEFICEKAEKADDKTLWVTDVKGTQMQSKIGPFVDTFLTVMVCAEVKGRVTEDKLAKRLEAALNKTIAKIEKNQKDDGNFAGNGGWASVLSQGLCSKGLNRARQAGAQVSEQALSKVERQVVQSFDQKAGAFKSAPATGAAAGAAGAPAPTDAGVPIYNASANLAGLQEVVNTNVEAEKKAKVVLAKKDATKEERDRAGETLKRVEETRKVQQDAVAAVSKQLDNKQFVAGFGSNGGEEFLSFMNISETMLVKGGAEWEKWDKTITEGTNKVQDKDGSWAGHHCITGKTFCTSAALLVLMADRTPIPAAAKEKEKETEKK